MSVVRVEHVCKDYLLGEQKVPALKDITLAIEPGVFLAIAGPSGSGKTTLLNLIGCIDTPTSGKIYINDQDVSGKTPDQLADLRARTIGFIFQTFNLFPVLTAAENVEYPLLQRPDVDKAGRRRRVDHFLDIVGLTPYAHHRPNQLSGGQRQRVAIARALAIEPAIVLADEPTANLDRATGKEILQLMKSINRKLGTTFIFSTHDRRVMAMADRLVRVEDGAISSLSVRADGKWKSVRERKPSAPAESAPVASPNT
ncbi:MAG: ABC transporter ATP-binding protein [Betaproteobacteria bacterium]|nr:ABC transporter ATP-binding protein [Betaproteobacteria bacterium]